MPSTMRAAVRALRELGPRSIVVAVATGSAQTCAELRREADEVICLTTPHPFYAVVNGTHAGYRPGGDTPALGCDPPQRG
jgi:predicted phosphoribosyltransferase